ncbi:GATA-binding factor 6-B [Pseudohyphozyma bogoriensis]|nr:GATA-binding factor 6-B [Pseudohyphozyma bogoriensis]
MERKAEEAQRRRESNGETVGATPSTAMGLNWTEQAARNATSSAPTMDWATSTSLPQTLPPQPAALPLPASIPDPQPLTYGAPVDWSQHPATLPNPPTWNPLYPPNSVQASNPFNTTLSGAPTFSPPATSYPAPNPFALPPTSVSQPTNAAFHSSFGSYQPIVGPYPRFLTPSPGPSILGAFDDLDQDLPSLDLDNPNSNGELTFDSIWKDFELPATGTTDPFAGMTIAGRSEGDGAAAGGSSGLTLVNSGGDGGRPVFELGNMGLEQLAGRLEGRMDIDGMGLEELGRRIDQGPRNGNGNGDASSGFEQSTMAGHPPLPPSLPIGFPSQQLLNNGNSFGHPSHLFGTSPAQGSSSESSPANDADPAMLSTAGDADFSAESPPDKGKGKAAKRPRKSKDGTAKEKDKVPGKKNRNPHATQLPGSGARKLPKQEAGDGHEGPSCSHCASIATPLWRRGPDDELLCNACGLYLKLHGKPRPKQFGKAQSAPRGAVAEAVASGKPPMCHNCEATSTPMWRKDLNGNLACNACSLYFKLHQVLRPVSLSRKQKSRLAAQALQSERAARPSTSSVRRSESPPSAPHPPWALPHPAQPDPVPTPPAPVVAPLFQPPNASAQSTQYGYANNVGAPASTSTAVHAGGELESDRPLKKIKVEEDWEAPTGVALTLSVPADYALPLAVATSTGFLVTYQVVLVSKLRKAAGIPYPNAYASHEQAEKDIKAKKFNCAQRAHANTLEHLPYFLFSLLFSGLEYPRLAAGFGAAWIVGRVVYTAGYATGNPKARTRGSFGSIGPVGLMLTSAYVSGKMVLAKYF